MLSFFFFLSKTEFWKEDLYSGDSRQIHVQMSYFKSFNPG